jgi:hypothetical protein
VVWVIAFGSIGIAFYAAIATVGTGGAAAPQQQYRLWLERELLSVYWEQRPQQQLYQWQYQ